MLVELLDYTNCLYFAEIKPFYCIKCTKIEEFIFCKFKHLRKSTCLKCMIELKGAGAGAEG